MKSLTKKSVDRTSSAVKKKKKADFDEVRDMEMSGRDDALAKQIAGSGVPGSAAESYWLSQYSKMSGANQARIMSMMGHIWTLIYRVSRTKQSSGSYYGTVSYEVWEPGFEDWGCSSNTKGFDSGRAMGINVHINGDEYKVNPGSEMWVIDHVHEQLDTHDAKIKEAQDRETRRQKALDRARSLLTADDFATLGLK